MEPRYIIAKPVRFVLLSALVGGAFAGALVAMPLAILTAPIGVAIGVFGVLVLPLLGAAYGLFFGFVPAGSAALLCVLAFGRRRLATLHVLGVSAPTGLLVFVAMFRQDFRLQPDASLALWFAAITAASFLTWALALWTGVAERLLPDD